MENEIQNEILNRIQQKLSDIYVDCPECENIDDDQYQCGTCGCGGGYGRIRVLKVVKIVEK